MEGIFELGNFQLGSGETLPGAKLAFETHGELNADRTNVILYPTWYAGRHSDNAPMVGVGRALDPSKYFIVVPDTFGNGLSSSPSNGGPGRFPLVSVYDNVEAQRRLLRERFDVARVALVVGYSMSAQQAFHWGALHSGFVERIAAICGSAKTSPHNWLFLEGLKTALQADPDWEKRAGPGLRAFATVYAGWFASQAFYRSGLHLRAMGPPLPSMSVYLDVVTSLFGSFDPRDLMALLATWQSADVSAHPTFGGDVKLALGAITARAVILPSRSDLYFPPEDNEAEVALMPNAKLAIIPSIWGHLAGSPVLNAEDVAFVEAELASLLAK
jgi:homoserine O-acetyltransferase